MKTDGVSGGRITQALIRGRSLRLRWLRNRTGVPALRSPPIVLELSKPLHLSLFPQLPFKNPSFLIVCPRSRYRRRDLEVAQPSPFAMPVLERQLPLAGEVKNQQRNSPHKRNKRQTAAKASRRKWYNKSC